MVAANLPAALHQRENDVLVRRVRDRLAFPGLLVAPALGVRRGAALDGLVNLDHAALAAELRRG
jgi:hypothetical protein